MPALHELQRAFGAYLLAEDDDAVCAEIVEGGFSAAERLRIHRNTCRSVLTETLRMTYPAVDRLVGRDFFDMASAQFIAAHPSRSGYLNEYGAEFAGFLAAFQPASALPYLADVARFEWALSAAANAVDAPALDPGALAAVAPEHHASLIFEPHPSVQFLALAYPADQIADAVLSGDDAAMAQVDLSSGPVRLIVHRGANGVEAQRLEPDAYRFVWRLCAGEALGSLLETTPPAASALLAEQFTKRRLTAFRVGADGAIEREERR
jgi:hypothetical protein